MHYPVVRLILGDQLNHAHSWFAEPRDDVLYLIAELHQEQAYVRHHIQKQCAFFAAMKAFADYLSAEGHHVMHLDLDATAEFADLPHLIGQVCSQVQARSFQYQRPDEYRLLEQLANLRLPEAIIGCVDTEHFLLPFSEITEQVPAGKAVLMEHFYRRMRKRFSYLMEPDGKPEGGQWNFDADNRNKLKAQDLLNLPAPLRFDNPISSIKARLERHGIESMGRVGDSLLWPINRGQALSLLAHFCQHCLTNFGRFQDAMTAEHPHSWSLYHSRLAFALNCKLLSPREVIETAIETYRLAQGGISLAQIEGFVRQILGWREYVRGMYWSNMPSYKTRNHLQALRPLPGYFWHGQTHMRCLQQAITQSLDFGYAHHIQRLMVTGNFALLTECNPDQVDAWYLGIYIDAIEWVELPNTRGMALFADGGLIATKPYAASGSYINKMSDYCTSCSYQVKQKSGEHACPLNSLYWRFMLKHRDRLANNPRIGMLYKTWDKMKSSDQQAILATAEAYINQLETL
ncbi:cryptochrome/photolyase family protein [Vibrio mimicus]|uniref:cryptochrome/photolyase family protein n=1 Tax=Vibrio mimicus TaxID=674 RepID=UPI0001BADC87|nr:cryptochrome/photolyase family protein [Vibrio mimicus]EEY37356.1 DNA photolyase [Vibrio mimicus MB451]